MTTLKKGRGNAQLKFLFMTTHTCANFFRTLVLFPPVLQLLDVLSIGHTVFTQGGPKNLLEATCATFEISKGEILFFSVLLADSSSFIVAFGGAQSPTFVWPKV